MWTQLKKCGGKVSNDWKYGLSQLKSWDNFVEETLIVESTLWYFPQCSKCNLNFPIVEITWETFHYSRKEWVKFFHKTESKMIYVPQCAKCKVSWIYTMWKAEGMLTKLPQLNS